MARDGVIWLSEQRIGGSVVARIGRRGDDLFAEFPGSGVLTANLRNGETCFEPAQGAEEHIVEKLNASLVAALVRHLEGKLTLHGSAVYLGTSVAAFLGPSGAGKSTLAAALCAKMSAQWVADDTIALEFLTGSTPQPSMEVIPTQTVAWLHGDARRSLGLRGPSLDKVPASMPLASVEKLYLRTLVGLVFDSRSDRPTIRALHGHEALALLSSSVIRFIIDDPHSQTREFDQLRRLVGSCSIYELRRPRDLAALDASLKLVHQLCNSDNLEGCGT